MKTKKICAVALIMCVLISICSVSAFAYAGATGYIACNLPMNQGDKHASTVAKANTGLNYFNITITNVTDNGSKPFKSVFAWTENTLGVNLSNTSMKVDEGTGTQTIYYSNVPNTGSNVVLNLDNPVDTTFQPYVLGDWSPN